MKSSIFWRIVFLLVVNISLVTIISAKDQWLEIRSTHFNLVGNANENEIREVAFKLEHFHQVFRQSFPKLNIETPFQTNVIVFKDDSTLNSYQLQTPKISNKYFLAGDDANYAILSINNSVALEQIYEGYAKFLLENNIGRKNLPAWLFEGLAEYFQTLKIRDGQNVEFGNSPKNVQILQQNKLIPFDIVFETDHFTLQNQGNDRKSIFRAESWALIQYLLKDEQNLEKIEKFIEMRQLGSDSKKALVESFQTSFAKVREEFSKFIQMNDLVSQTIKLEIKPPTETLTVSNILEAKSYAVLADFFYYQHRFKEAETLIEKSLKLEPNQSLALTTLALIKAQGYYYEEAEKLAERAIKIEPDNYFNQYRFALALSKRGMTEYGFVSGYNVTLANQMRDALKQAIELNPSFSESYALLAFVNFVRNEQLDESLGFINQVLQTAAGNQKYQIRLSEILLRKEKFSEARKLAIQVFQNTPSEGARLYSQNTIQRIDSTEYQLERIRNQKTKYVNDDIVTEKPLSDEEIRKLREKAINDEIRAILRRPKPDEKRVLGSLTKIFCGKNKVDFFVVTQNGLFKLRSNSFDGIILLSLVEEMSDYRLGCGTLVRENNASIIFKSDKDSAKTGEIISIEFVPKGFKLQN